MLVSFESLLLLLTIRQLVVTESNHIYLQDNYSEMQTGGVDQSQQSQQFYEGLKQEMHMNFLHLHSQQQQHWEQLNSRLDQMVVEVRSGFESLSNLFSNVAEMNTDSLKHLFRQELDLLKQDFMKAITTDHIGTEPSHAAADISFHRGDKVGVHIETPHHASAFVEDNINTYTNINSHNDKPLQEIMDQSTSDTFSTRHQLQNHISELSSDKLSQSQQSTTCLATMHGAVAANGTLESYMQQDIGVKSYAKAASQSTHPHAAGATEHSKNISDRLVNASILCPASFTTLSESVEATGSYAEAVSNQLKQMRSSRASSVSSRHRSDSSSSLKNINGRMPAKNDDPSAMADPGQQMFTIYKSEQFSVSNKPYLPPAMYSSGIPCKARVRINIIEGTGVFAVHIHISKGDYDDYHNWPLRLSGFGYIWNITSRSRTQIWQLHPVLCQKPPSMKQEFIFPAEVCLKTVRGSYPNVTYKSLVAKHYAENNRLNLIWDLQAVTN
ncbi:hypothetical protein BsWGS_28054 [Bradybaena similaris]